MKRVVLYPLVAAVILAFQPSAARGDTLATPLDGTNANQGVFFDIKVARHIVFTGIQVRFNDDNPSDEFRVYIRPGTHVGFEDSSVGWTSIDDALVMTSTGVGDISSIGFFPTPFPLGAGETFGVYILRQNTNSGHGVKYGNGDGVGTLEAFNDEIAFFEGVGSGSFFGSTSSQRVANVILHYEIEDDIRPTIQILGKRRIRTSERRVRIYGLLSDNVSPMSVDATYKQQTGKGATRKVKKTLPAGGSGVFSLNVKTFAGSNKITFVGKDKMGNLSPATKVVVVGEQ